MTYESKHLRSIQALPADRRITVFVKRDMYFLETLLNTCDVFANSVALQIDKRVKPLCELVVGSNFFDEVRASCSAYLQFELPKPNGGDLVATFNSWNVYTGYGHASEGRLPSVGPDGAYFLVLATSSHPDQQVLLGSVAFVLTGKGKV